MNENSNVINQACLALISQRVSVPHPSKDRTVEGVVVGYDPGPYQRLEGDYVVIKPYKAEGEVCHPPWISVAFDKVTQLDEAAMR